MPYYVVTIQDKELNGEPDIGMCVVEAEDEQDALQKSNAFERCEHLASVMRWCRCVPRVKRFYLNRWVRSSSIIQGAPTRAPISE